MSRLRFGDVIFEIADLASDVLDEIRQQTTYYRASVYKNEALGLIKRRVDHLAFISRILKEDSLAECVNDYRASENHSHSFPTGTADQDDQQPHQVSDVCAVTMRVMRLLLDAERVLEEIRISARARATEGNDAGHSRQIVTTITRHRRDLLAMSRHGSRSWSFLQTF